MREAVRIAVPLEAVAGRTPVRPLAVVDAVDAASSEIRVSVHDAGALPAALVEEWGALAEVAAEPNCYAEPWFVLTSLETLGGGEGLRFVAVRRGETLIGLIPLAIESYYGRTRVRFVQNWRHHHHFLGTPLIRRGEVETFWTALLEALDGADWAPNFLHLRKLGGDGPVHRGLVAAAAALGRSCPAVHREARALLEGVGDAETYYRAVVRPKKRKELRRLRHRLEELGEVRLRTLVPQDALEPWCDAFLRLEAAGWKGEERSALACDPATESFFRRTVAGARAAGRLQFLRLDLDGQAIAMLVNFLASPGGFSFKTAFDPDYARFSPGVLIQLENLRLVEQAGLAWMDSCAAEHHPMIESLWSGRRRIVRVTVRLSGVRRGAVFAACRALECGSAALRRLIGRSGA